MFRYSGKPSEKGRVEQKNKRERTGMGFVFGSGVGNNMMLTWCWLAPTKWLAEWLGVEDVGKDEDEKNNNYPF